MACGHEAHDIDITLRPCYAWKTLGTCSPLSLDVSVRHAEAPQAVQSGVLGLPLHVLPLLPAQALARRQDLLVHHLQC